MENVFGAHGFVSSISFQTLQVNFAKDHELGRHGCLNRKQENTNERPVGTVTACHLRKLDAMKAILLGQ